MAYKGATNATNDDVYNAGFEVGKQEGLKAFWDAYVPGTTGYSLAFAGYRWTDTTFAPNKNITLPNTGNSANMMFYYTGISNLAEILESRGLYIDARNYVGSNGFMSYFYNSAAIKHIGRILFPADPKRWEKAFWNCTALHTIDELPSVYGTYFDADTFYKCYALENIKFTGEITTSNFYITWSKKLSKASLNSLIIALSPTITGKTARISLTAVNTAFETSTGAGDGSTSQEWKDLIAIRPNWTISLYDS